ncbi:MAG: hypothetical protein LCH52_16535 [Bacteroidetes bacterium]|nr:hypothetical protein [Bacteroidota bacterium]
MIEYVYIIAAAIGTLTILFGVMAAVMPSRKVEVPFDPVNTATLLKYSVSDNHRDVPVSNMHDDDYAEEDNFTEIPFQTTRPVNSNYTNNQAYYPLSVRDFTISGSRIVQPARNNFKVYNSSRLTPLQFR